MSISNYAEQKILDHVLGGAAFAQPASITVKLHIGDPGEDGIANPAVNVTRQPVTFAAASNPAGTKVSNSQVQWTNVLGTETYSHVSLWEAATPNCLWSGPLTTPVAVTATGTFTIASGGLTVSLD